MKFFQHSAAIVESKKIGTKTRIWAFSHVQSKAIIGKECNIGENCFIENGALVGNRVTIKNGVSVWDGITLSDDVFVGPNATFTNDRHPRSPRARFAEKRYRSNQWLSKIMVGKGATIGANATLVGPLKIGKSSFIAAGSVVIRDVKDFELVAGNPCRHIGWVNQKGERVE